MFDSYINSLLELEKSIPINYIFKKELKDKINYCIEDMAYKPPELLSEYFSYYCNIIIPFLPKDKKNNKWIIQPWENIHKVAKKNIEIYKKKIN